MHITEKKKRRGTRKERERGGEKAVFTCQYLPVCLRMRVCLNGRLWRWHKLPSEALGKSNGICRGKTSVTEWTLNWPRNKHKKKLLTRFHHVRGSNVEVSAIKVPPLCLEHFLHFSYLEWTKLFCIRQLCHFIRPTKALSVPLEYLRSYSFTPTPTHTNLSCFIFLAFFFSYTPHTSDVYIY